MSYLVPLNFDDQLVDGRGVASESFQRYLVGLLSSLTVDTALAAETAARIAAVLAEAVARAAAITAEANARIAADVAEAAARAAADQELQTLGAFNGAEPRQSLSELEQLAAVHSATGPGRSLSELEQLAAAVIPARPGSGHTCIQDSSTNAGLYPAAGYPDGSFRRETDTAKLFQALLGSWVQIIAPAFLPFLVAAATHGALKRDGAGLAVRVGDDSGASFLKVLDDAYGAGWDGNTEVPTKNSVYDQVETKADAESPGADTLVLAKITGGGTNGSLTWNDQGVISGYVKPT